MPKSMEFLKALALSLGEIASPVIAEYRLGLLVHSLYRRKEFGGKPITRIRKQSAEKSDFSRHLKALLDEGVLSPYPSLPANIYSLLGRTHESVEDVACAVDLFGYTSHLTAMSYHGLTDRIPTKIFLSSPDARRWKSFAEERMKKDLGDDYQLYRQNGLPTLSRSNITKIGKVEIKRFSSIHLGAYINVRNRSTRVATIGRTFLDMLRNPEYCGGINHVLQVFDLYARKYLRLITDEIDRNGSPIDKVRAGYIIDERLGIENSTVSNWAQYAQRGGSRKLDASSEFIPEWSDRWCLSLNVFEKTI